MIGCRGGMSASGGPSPASGWSPPAASPCLAPEIRLLYKAKNGRPKDETDFAAALPVLTKPQGQWLSDALSLVYGPAHPWPARLLAPHGGAPRDEQA